MFFSDALGISHYAPQSHSFPCPSKRKLKKIVHLSHLSMIYTLVLVALGAVVCHAVYLFAQIALLANYHCNESLVRFKTSGFWYSISIGLSPKLLLDILLLLSS